MSSLNYAEKQEIRKKTAKPMLYVAIGSMVMLFGGLTSAYVVRHAEGNWLVFTMPQAFYFSTALMLLSSLTMNFALMAAKKNNFSQIKQALAATLVLGIGFMICQFMGWSQLSEQKVFFAGKDSNASGSFFFVLTGLHLAHLLGGMLYLLAVNIKALKNKYTAQNYLSLQLCATYWHFLDGLWIYLFFFLIFIS
ncbi:MAG: cytochrome c oxidase subunit 3 [Bacteroidetes bacterium]|nr:cytochrome c oxidase subunit 3 [Bacteroidota bacterium]MBK9672571.1 cytochrome c oxidase subunit 3 [Bacteroidota bacterium]MBK9800199.1 cytochrome c oxidase subunit 3 [Bacteroidota bacterium]MBP6413074.1 cytochrome c oxidase subunit 3 [Bacteroidia bacterium]